jgi:hypothetical protein
MLETVLRTPEDRFLNLPGYPFEPHYVHVDGLRVHYVDEARRLARWCSCKQYVDAVHYMGICGRCPL